MTSRDDYSALDRMLHTMAFRGPTVQLAAADLETALFGRRFRGIAVESPLFVTSLPRAGTTLLLEVFARLPEFASHGYRDMPFVLAPVLWDRISRGFRKKGERRERAHADGVLIDYDSPEAFEEVAWRAFWPEKFEGETIGLWSADDDKEAFRRFFHRHMQKVVFLRRDGSLPRTRYLSKNNGNIARLEFLTRVVPGATILVPFRSPVEQAASLLRQHLRFLEMHDRDPFSRTYMADLGHLEFGRLHRPVAFAGMEEVRERLGPESMDYWVGYWTAAYSHIVRHRELVTLVSYERLCRGVRPALSRLAESVGLAPDRLLEAAGEVLRPPRKEVGAGDGLEDGRLEEALALHERMLRLSVV